MGKILGIDQGITTVGWGIIDTDKGDVIDAGVRLFPEGDKTNNEKRRGFRESRRIKRRKANRKRDLQKLLVTYGLFVDYGNELNPYVCRKKAIYEKVSLEELNCALFNICKHRGSSLETAEEENEPNKENSTKYQLASNDVLIKKGKYICEIQLDRLQNQGKIRGINNNFRTLDYKKELERILETQEINDVLSKQIIDVIIRKRHFDEGPGSFKSQTPYGRIYNDDGSVKIGMIEKMTGHCSVYPNELRAPKLAPSAELFNLLNDLNNLSINGERIEVDIKKDIIKTALEKGNITPKKVLTLLNADLADVNGFRVDKSMKPIITELIGYKIIKKLFDEYGCGELSKNFDLMDNIASILTRTKIIDERISELKEIINNKELVEQLAIQTKFKNYHSLSLKAIKEINQELMETQLNQMQILALSNKFEFNKSNGSQKGKKKISTKKEAILSPVALRSYRQAIKVINEARKQYGEFESIVVETTRDKNSFEQKSRILEQQKKNEDRNKKVMDVLSEYKNIIVNAKLKEKVSLYFEQDCKTGYTLQEINLDLLIKDPTAYEVDHIIPVSISLDDSYNNKTLVTRTENQQKGNLTPIMAFEANKFSSGSLEAYQSYIRSLYANKRISRKKYENYMYAKDINKYENMKDFIARNLVDTSYANRLLFNTLNDYFKDNEINTTVHTVKGLATSRFRKYLDLKKDRDKDYSHHAVDALLIASIKKMSLFKNLFKKIEVTNEGLKIDVKTGEKVENIHDNYVNTDDVNFINQINSFEVKKYSHMIDTKANRSIADQTIYSTRKYDGEDYVIKKYRDIYDKKITALAEDILNGKADNKYLIGKHDKQSMKSLKEVVNHYYNLYKDDNERIASNKDEIKLKFNPFYIFHEETGDWVRKYSKNGNGPIIKSVKYSGGKLGSHVDISKKYEVKNKKVVLQQISPFRTDFYLDNDNVYKFVTVKYANVNYSKKDNIFSISEEWYEEQKKKKKISNNAKFLFSMHRNELIQIKKDDDAKLLLFIGTNDDAKNTIECKTIDHRNEQRINPTIGKSIQSIKKYASDALGNITEIKDSKLKLKFK